MKLDIKTIDIGLLRDCWSSACAVGHNKYPSLSAMQAEFEKWLDENNIKWRDQDETKD
jgi:hypothetical protein